jgi:hypothetical protein
MMALRACGYNGCSTADQLRALKFAEKNGARVINMSL